MIICSIGRRRHYLVLLPDFRADFAARFLALQPPRREAKLFEERLIRHFRVQWEIMVRDELDRASGHIAMNINSARQWHVLIPENDSRKTRAAVMNDTAVNCDTRRAIVSISKWLQRFHATCARMHASSPIPCVLHVYMCARACLIFSYTLFLACNSIDARGLRTVHFRRDCVLLFYIFNRCVMSSVTRNRMALREIRS